MSGELHTAVQDVLCDDKNNNNEVKHNVEEQPTVIKSSQLCCNICNIKVTSQRILQKHLDGKKHKSRAERKGKSFVCELCEITANSATQLKIHLNSLKHKSKVQRKEYVEFTDISTTSKGIWIIIFCIFCIFLNLLLLFKIIL